MLKLKEGPVMPREKEDTSKEISKPVFEITGEIQLEKRLEKQLLPYNMIDVFDGDRDGICHKVQLIWRSASIIKGFTKSSISKLLI